MGFTFSSLGTAGPVLGVLALLSVASIAVLVARLMALSGVAAGRAEREAFLDGRADAPSGRSPADRIALQAAQLIGTGTPAQVVSAELEAAGNSEVALMSRGLRFLELTGMIAPLLGLLGTVLGMIVSFRSLELASGAANASILAGGIWQALLTTAAGLIVAIPAVAGAAVLAGRVEAGALEIERTIARVLRLDASRSGS